MKKKKVIKFTEKELVEEKARWLKMGKMQAQKEITRKLAETLGLFELFEIAKEIE